MQKHQIQSSNWSNSGNVLEFDVQPDGRAWRSTLRMLIKIDINAPLARGKTVNLHGLSTWVPITYEKLTRICFKCGRLSHGNKKEVCSLEEGQDTGGQYGIWLWEIQGCIVERRGPQRGS